MRTLDQWLAAYAESHQHPTNKTLHNICVPLIFFLIIAGLWKFSFILLCLAAAVAVGFYYRLSPSLGVAGAIAIGACTLLQIIFSFGAFTLLVLFVLAWIGQFYGHKIEGRKPSFFEDLQFLLIGPLWVAEPWLAKYDIQR